MKQHQTAKLSPKLSKIPQTSGAALGHLGPPWATATPWVSPSRAVEQHAARRRAAAARCPQGPGGRTWRRSFFWHVLLVDDFYHTKNETEIWTQVIYIYNIYIYYSIRSIITADCGRDLLRYLCGDKCKNECLLLPPAVDHWWPWLLSYGRRGVNSAVSIYIKPLGLKSAYRTWVYMIVHA